MRDELKNALEEFARFGASKAMRRARRQAFLEHFSRAPGIVRYI
jgi:hypothetical protein